MNGTQHMMIGAGSGAVVGLTEVMRHQSDYYLQTGSPVIVAATAGGVIGGMVPDLLEPATSPNHRQVFHSLVALLLVGIGFYWLWERPDKDTVGRAFVKGLLAGFGSHLVADASTAKGLPTV